MSPRQRRARGWLQEQRTDAGVGHVKAQMDRHELRVVVVPAIRRRRRLLLQRRGRRERRDVGRGRGVRCGRPAAKDGHHAVAAGPDCLEKKQHTMRPMR